MEEETFRYFWQLIKHHGGVAEFYEAEARTLWTNYSRDQQREIYCAIRDKLKAGKFVNYVPTKAILENVPKEKPKQVLTYYQYVERYKTTEERDGWKMANPTGQKVIYVKGGQ